MAFVLCFGEMIGRELNTSTLTCLSSAAAHIHRAFPAQALDLGRHIFGLEQRRISSKTQNNGSQHDVIGAFIQGILFEGTAGRPGKTNVGYRGQIILELGFVDFCRCDPYES